MVYLIDTNILIRLADRKSPRHQIVRSSLRKLRQSNHQLHITPQNCAEFWNVMTRPTDQNGMGLTTADTNRLLSLVERLFALVSDNPSIYSEWRRLVVDYSVSGVQVHDARLVAAMLVHSISHVLTFNTADFARYSPLGITAVDPNNI